MQVRSELLQVRQLLIALLRQWETLTPRAGFETMPLSNMYNTSLHEIMSDQFEDSTFFCVSDRFIVMIWSFPATIYYI